MGGTHFERGTKEASKLFDVYVCGFLLAKTHVGELQNNKISIFQLLIGREEQIKMSRRKLIAIPRGPLSPSVLQFTVSPDRSGNRVRFLFLKSTSALGLVFCKYIKHLLYNMLSLFSVSGLGSKNYHNKQ